MDNEQLMDLLCRAGQGDQEAFERLYGTTSPTLFGVCLNLLRDREQAEEILQESFVRIWHQAPEYTPSRGGVMTWMISITRYRAIDALRYRRRRPESGLDESRLAALEDEDPGPFEETVLAGDSTALARCMEQLSVSQRQSIRLAFLQGLTHEELVSRLEKPLGTIKSWIRRGLQSLRQCLSA